MTRFKYFGRYFEPELFSKKMFNEFFDKDGNLRNEHLINDEIYSKTIQGSVTNEYNTFKNDILFLIEHLNVFDRDKFIIKQFPQVLKEYYLLKDHVEEIPKTILKEALFSNGFMTIWHVINWKIKNHKSIENAFNDFCIAYKIPEITPNYNQVPFLTIEEILLLVKSENTVKEDAEVTAKRIWERVSKKHKMSDLIEMQCLLSLEKAISFNRNAFFLTTKKS